MFASKVSRIGVLILKQLSGGKLTSITRAGYNTSSCYNQYLQPLSETKLLRGVIFHKHHLFSTVSASDSSNEGIEQKEKISVTFVDKDGDEIHIKVPTGMSMLEAAHENDIDLEGKIGKYLFVALDCTLGDLPSLSPVLLRAYFFKWIRLRACEGSIACSTCHVIVMDMDYYNKLEDPTDEENDMLDLAFGLTESSRLGCQVIAKPELDGIRLAIPAATRNFAVDGYVPKPH
ncbi:unnamed protein product [Prunus brigantina]